jgi:HEAT repeat protein
MFLAKINSDLSKKELIRFFSVADLFTNNQLLIGRVRDIINKRRELDAEIFNFISNSPKGRINLLLIDLEKIVSDNLLHIEILDLIAERRVIESEPYLIKYIKNRYFWEKRPNSTIQIHVCSVLGKFGTNEAIDALIKTAKPQSSFFLSSTKRDEVRAAATKALLELEPTKKINDALEILENDKSQLIKNVFKAKLEE